MYRLTEAFPYLINRVGIRMGVLFSSRIESYGVTLPMYRVLAALWQRGGQSLGSLGEMTSIEISTLSRLVGVMQRKGLISKTRPDSNGRTVEINLTRPGRALVEKLIPIAERFEEVGLRGLAADQVEILKKNLVAVYRNLDVLEQEGSKEANKAAKGRSAIARSRARTRLRTEEDKREWPRPSQER